MGDGVKYAVKIRSISGTAWSFSHMRTILSHIIYCGCSMGKNCFRYRADNKTQADKCCWVWPNYYTSLSLVHKPKLCGLMVMILPPICPKLRANRPLAGNQPRKFTTGNYMHLWHPLCDCAKCFLWRRKSDGVKPVYSGPIYLQELANYDRCPWILDTIMKS